MNRDVQEGICLCRFWEGTNRGTNIGDVVIKSLN